MRRQWVALDERIKAFDAEFAAAAKAQDGAKRLLSIPGCVFRSIAIMESGGSR